MEENIKKPLYTFTLIVLEDWGGFKNSLSFLEVAGLFFRTSVLFLDTSGFLITTSFQS